ncbi:MAG TPA: pilus assembly protein [Planctomycetaceae bacterium]|nr:pilus assembly protein [Planctomycetaceae bacterium]
MRLLNSLIRQKQTKRERCGSTITETAVVLPIFFLILFGFIEFGHVFMTIHALNSAARKAARLGVSETATTADVRTLANQIVNSSIPAARATILVKNGSTFDSAGVDAASINYASLPDIELLTAERRQLFIVRVSVPYSDVAILGPKWLGGLTVYGQSVMRRE